MRASYERVGLVRPGDDRSGPVPAASRRATSCCSRDRRRAGASQGLLCPPHTLTAPRKPGTGFPLAPAPTPARTPRACGWQTADRVSGHLLLVFFPLGWSVAPRCRPATQSSPVRSQTGTVQLRVRPRPSDWDDRVCVRLLARTMLAACATAQRTAIAVGLP